MKFVIDFNEETNVFKVYFERNVAAKGTDEQWPPPPPYGNQMEAMTKWLNEAYSDTTRKFADQEVSGITMSFQAPDPIK